MGVVRPNPPDTSLVSTTCDKVDLRSVTPWRGVNGATLGCQINTTRLNVHSSRRINDGGKTD